MRQPKKARTKAQAAAGAAFAAGGRAAQARTRAASIAKTGKPPSVSKARHQAALKWAAAGRASQARKRAHLKPLPKKAAALSLPGAGLHDRPVCAAVAVAEHLYAATGIAVPDADIIRLGDNLAGGCLLDYLEAATGGFGGARLGAFWRCDEDEFTPGLVYGVRMRGGYHAVLAHPLGVVSWGLILPRLGVPVEAWQLCWES